MPVRVYELYPAASGGFSNRTDDYSGTIVAVAASSNEQAHDLAQNDVWATNPDEPGGILWVSRKVAGHDHRLFNGDEVYGNQVFEVRHGANERNIVAWMRDVLEGGES